MTIPCDKRPSYYGLQGLAHGRVQSAKRRGLLKKLDGKIRCADCGAVATMYEHRDYRKPLDVRPVCRRCNKKSGHTEDTKEFLRLVREKNIDTETATDILLSSIGGIPMYKKICARKGCGKEFETSVPWGKYCGNSCKQMAWAVRKIKKDVAEAKAK